MKRLRSLLVVLAASLVMTGCEFDAYELPLPGGTDAGDDPMTVTVQFRDVLDLVPKSTVKVNDVSVGNVTEVDLEGQVAEVTLELRNDTELPDNAVAEIRMTSLLGEKFVQLAPPEEGASDNLLETGDRIPLERTGRNPEVEEVLGALSLLLNGGGLAQMKTIMSELNLAFEGREGAARSAFRQIEIFMRQLDQGKGDIVDAIESLNRLSIAVNDQTSSIDLALEELPSALTSLDRQRDDMVKMLQALNRLGGVAVRVIKLSKRSTIESFRQLVPVLTELANSGDDFANAFHVFLTYPFVDETVGRDPQVARNLHMGDYTNLSIQSDIHVGPGGGGGDPTAVPSEIDPTVILDNVARCLRSGSLDSKACKKVLRTPEGIAELQEACKKRKNRDKPVCKELLNRLPSGGGGDGGGGPLDPITSGLPRAGFDSRTAWSGPSPTMGDLMNYYDPSLVSLLVPGMVVDR